MKVNLGLKIMSRECKEKGGTWGGGGRKKRNNEGRKENERLIKYYARYPSSRTLECRRSSTAGVRLTACLFPFNMNLLFLDLDCYMFI